MLRSFNRGACIVGNVLSKPKIKLSSLAPKYVPSSAPANPPIGPNAADPTLPPIVDKNKVVIAKKVQDIAEITQYVRLMEVMMAY